MDQAASSSSSTYSVYTPTVSSLALRQVSICISWSESDAKMMRTSSWKEWNWDWRTCNLLRIGFERAAGTAGLAYPVRPRLGELGVVVGGDVEGIGEGGVLGFGEGGVVCLGSW